MSKFINSPKKKPLVAAISVVAIGLASASFSAYADADSIEVNIKRSDADSALMELARQSGIQIIMSTEIGVEKQLPAISGEFTFEEALTKMLAGSGLTYQFISDDSVVVKEEGKEKKAEGEKDEDIEEVVVTGSRLIRDRGQMTRQMTVFDRDEIERSGATRLDEFLRRLPQNVNAPTSIGLGFTDSSSTRDFGLGANAFGGSSVNLRGLGSQYTLILINGRRPAAGGQFGDITDISSIPIGQIETIEVLYDGAASIYGADAVGGVLNITTRKDYQGTELMLSYEDTTEGGGKRWNVDLGHTFNWDTGSLTARVSYTKQEAIDGSERDLSLGDAESFAIPPSANGNIGGEVDFRTGERLPLMWVQDLNGDGDTLDVDPLGDGRDERITGGLFLENSWGSTSLYDRQQVANGEGLAAVNPPADPGAVPSDPETDGYRAVRVAELPGVYAGDNLSLYDIPDTDELGDSTYVPFENNTLSPEEDVVSLGLNLQQELTDALSFGLDLNYTKTDRGVETRSANQGFRLNPRSLDNAFVTNVDYAFQNSLPIEQQKIDVETLTATGNLDWDVSDDWRATLGFSVSDSESTSETKDRIRQGSGDPSLPNINNLVNGGYQDWSTSPSTWVVIPGTGITQPNLGFDSPEALLAAVGLENLQVLNDSKATEVDLTVDGTLFSITGGDVTSSVRLGRRAQENRVASTYGFGDFYPLFPGSESEYDETYESETDFVSAEIFAPLIGADNALSLVENFGVSASVGYEEYSEIEDTATNWQVGFNWGLTDWMTVRLNRSFSVRVPPSALNGMDDIVTRGFGYRIVDSANDPLPQWGDPDYPTDFFWTQNGAVDDIQPERSYNTSLGFVFTPTFAEGLDIQLNISETDTKDQIGTIGAAGDVFLRSELDLIDQGMHPFARIATAWDADNLADRSGNAPIAGVSIVRDARQRNIGSTFNRNIDMTVNYRIAETDVGDFFVTWRHNYLDTNEVLRSNICNDDSLCVSGVGGTRIDRGIDQAIDTVGTVNRNQMGSAMGDLAYIVALPEHRSTLNFAWAYKGFSVDLTGRFESDTSVIQQGRDQNGSTVSDASQPYVLIEDVTSPDQTIDVAFTYDFAQSDLDLPGFLANSRVRLAIDGAWIKDREVTSRVAYNGFADIDPAFDPMSVAEDAETNRFNLRPRGRTVRLSFTSNF